MGFVLMLFTLWEIIVRVDDDEHISVKKKIARSFFVY